jgi:surface antigen
MVQTFQNGQLISTGTPQNAAQQYGYQIPKTPLNNSATPTISSTESKTSAATASTNNQTQSSAAASSNGGLLGSLFGAVRSAVNPTNLYSLPSNSTAPVASSKPPVVAPSLPDTGYAPAQISSNSIAPNPISKDTLNGLPPAGSSGIANSTAAVTPGQLQTGSAKTQSTVSKTTATPQQLNTLVVANVQKSESGLGISTPNLPVTNNNANVGATECTTFAQYFYNTVHPQNPLPLPIKNADTWFASASAPNSGVAVKPASTPPSEVPVGSIVVWGAPTHVAPGDPIPPGHVAVVTANNGTSLTIAEANWFGSNKIDTRTIPVSQLSEMPGKGGAEFPLEGYILPAQQ